MNSDASIIIVDHAYTRFLRNQQKSVQCRMENFLANGGGSLIVHSDSLNEHDGQLDILKTHRKMPIVLSETMNPPRKMPSSSRQFLQFQIITILKPSRILSTMFTFSIAMNSEIINEATTTEKFFVSNTEFFYQKYTKVPRAITLTNSKSLQVFASGVRDILDPLCPYPHARWAKRLFLLRNTYDIYDLPFALLIIL
uniref:Uncharacterized protein n=1 Tax=Heterorhabditis bacteriophora TaxID=37862 RepID=A0A1I7WEA4_HETBA